MSNQQARYVATAMTMAECARDCIFNGSDDVIETYVARLGDHTPVLEIELTNGQRFRLIVEEII